MSAIEEVTVVVPARNAARTIERCVRSALAMRAGRLRLIVLDDHSTDDTAALAAAAGAEVVPVPDPGGLGVGRNLAFELCRTRHLAFLNADCYPEPDWLEVLHGVLIDTGAAMAGGKQRELRSGTLAERWKAVHLRQDLGDEVVPDPDFLSGGNMLLDLDRIGEVRLDPRYRIAYEDVDFCRRLRAAGRRLHYDPRAVVGHDHAETLRTLPKKVWSYGASSTSVGPVTNLATALRGFTRMHRRPHDQIRTALRADLRAARPDFLAVDLFLLACSLGLFLRKGLQPSTSD